MGDNLKQKTLDALTWTTVDRFGQQAVQFIIGLIFARLLTPFDYGLIGMITIFAALSYVLVESGFGQALIRKQNTTETDYNTIFYFNILTSLSLYLLLFFSAPFIASYFNQPQLTLIGRVIFIAILFNAFYLVPFTKLVKVMDFKSVAKVNILSVILSGTLGIILALLHYGVWALVTQQVSFHLFRMIFYYFFNKWSPKLLFSFQVIREFWSFSIHLLGTSLLNVIFNNLYMLLLSKFYPIKQVGFYSQGKKLSETFNSGFQTILVGSTYSLFTQIQNDDKRFLRIFREIAQKTSIITFPIMLVLIAIANPFIYVLLTSKWMMSVPYFQLLCLAALFEPLYGLTINALNSRGQSKITFRVEIIKKCLILLSVVLCFNFGVIAMLWGYAMACFIAYLISILYLKKDLKHYIRHQLADFLGCVSIGLVIAACAYGLSFLIYNNYLLLATQIILSGILYILSIRLFYTELYNKSFQLIVTKITVLKNWKENR